MKSIEMMNKAIDDIAKKTTGTNGTTGSTNTPDPQTTSLLDALLDIKEGIATLNKHFTDQNKPTEPTEPPGEGETPPTENK